LPELIIYYILDIDIYSVIMTVFNRLNAMASDLVNHYGITIEQVQNEVLILDLNNIKKFPCSLSLRDQFYSMWQRFGPQAARTATIPYVWQGKVPLPSEYFGRK